MSSDNNDIVRRPQNEGQMVEIDDARDLEQASNPIKTAHRLLQGKYPLVILLALLGGTLAAVVTHRFVKDQWVSTGTVQVESLVPFLLYQTEFNGERPKFDAFVDLQAKLIVSEKVLDKAVMDPQFVEAYGPDSSDMALASEVLLNNLKVVHESGSEMIDITVSDPNPLRPAVATNAIIRAYLSLYNSTELDTKAKQIKDLEERKAELTKRVDEATRRTLEVSLPYGVENLDQGIALRESRLNDLHRDLEKVQLALAGMPSNSSATTRPQVIMSPEIWALTDGEMSQLLLRKRNAILDLQKLRAAGLLENHPQMIAGKAAIDAIDDLIQVRLQFDNEHVIPGENSNLQLVRQEEVLQKWIKDVEAEREKLVTANRELKRTGGDAAAATEELKQVAEKVHKIEFESVDKGRVSAFQYFTRPKLDSNKRRMATAAGGAGGAFVVVAFFIVLGLANRRMHRISDIQPEGSLNRGLRLLGVVPMLSADGSMSDNTPAAQAVHRIRTRLQIEAATSDRRVLTVTSPESGNGKTSVITALGMSFASSGSRVLLIDCDLVGAGLTARLNGRVRRNIVDILRSQTRVTEEQLAQAARVANKSSDRFLQALIDFEYLTPEAVKLAVTTHKESNLGLLDALNSEPLKDCVAATRWPRLFVLPRGAATGVDAAQLSPLALRRLFQQARNLFDVVLVDTGPLFGSIEATLAASESDGTVLVVSRGESAGAVQAAVTDLKSMNCKVMGAVFNRARAKDVASYGYTSTSQSRSRPVATLTDDTDMAVGPIAATGSGRNGDSSSRSAPVKKLANPDMPR